MGDNLIYKRRDIGNGFGKVVIKRKTWVFILLFPFLFVTLSAESFGIMEIVYLIIGVVVGGVVAYLLTNQKKKGVESTLMLTAQRLDQEEKKNESLVLAAEKAEEKFCSLADELTQARIDVASLQTQV